MTKTHPAIPIFPRFSREPNRLKRRREKGKPASALDTFHELGDDIISEVAAKVARVKLYIPLQYYVEEHLYLSFDANFSSVSLIPIPLPVKEENLAMQLQDSQDGDSEIVL